MSESAKTVSRCPVCANAEAPPSGELAPGFVCRIGTTDFQQPNYHIMDCQVCGLLFRTPTLSDQEFLRYYKTVDFHKWEACTLFPTERAVVNWLDGQLPNGSRILDFGCSSGRLLAPIVSEFSCFGLEINEKAAQSAAAKGLKMIQAYMLNSMCNSFDAITMIDVFEHLTEPLKVFETLFSVLRPGGALLVVTGNGDYRVCRLDPAQFWYFRNVEHTCMLTERSSKFIAARLGAKLETWQNYSHYKTPPLSLVRQGIQQFAYWQFRSQTLLSRTVLSVFPYLKRAKKWPVAPSFTCGRDHVLSIFRKSAS